MNSATTPTSKPTRRSGFSYWFRLYLTSAVLVVVFESLAMLAMFPLGVWSVGLYVLAVSFLGARWITNRLHKPNQARQVGAFVIILVLSLTTLLGAFVSLTIGGSTVTLMAAVVALLRYQYLDR